MSITARIAPSPSRQECEAAWAQGQPSVVFSVEAADLLTPVSAYLRLARFDGGTGKNTLLLESVEGGTSRGRYSVIALKPGTCMGRMLAFQLSHQLGEHGRCFGCGCIQMRVFPINHIAAEHKCKQAAGCCMANCT